MSFQMQFNSGTFTSVAGTALGQGGGGHDSSGQGSHGAVGLVQEAETFNPFLVPVPSDLAATETLGHSWRLGGQHDMTVYLYV